MSMKRGKAGDLYGLSVEHLQYSHPILCCVLAKLFNWFMHIGRVPSHLGISCTIHFLKAILVVILSSQSRISWVFPKVLLCQRFLSIAFCVALVIFKYTR